MPEHTYNNHCPRCPGEHGGPGQCDSARYSVRRVRFIMAHYEAYQSAYLNPDQQAASNELERLDREYRTLPARHDCWCWCPAERRGYPPCVQCKARRDKVQHKDVAVEIGRTSLVHAPMPDVTLLDLAEPIRHKMQAIAICHWLNEREAKAA